MHSISVNRLMVDRVNVGDAAATGTSDSEVTSVVGEEVQKSIKGSDGLSDTSTTRSTTSTSQQHAVMNALTGKVEDLEATVSAFSMQENAFVLV